MSSVDTSTWNPDPALNESIGDIPLNKSASIDQTWQAIQMLMAALKGDTSNIKLTINQPDGTTIVATNQTLTVVDNGHSHTIANVAGLQTALNGKASNASMTGATASADGASGLVPKPEAGDQDKVLKGDGTWGGVASSQVSSLPSSKITSMTGYSKPSSTSAIDTTDSLNGAIGKLEKALDGKADDSAVVHASGNEAVAGTKIFSDVIYVSNSTGTVGYMARHLEAAREGAWPTQRTRFSAIDKNNKYIGDFSIYSYTIGTSLYNDAQIILYDPSDASALGKFLSFDSLNWTNFTFAPDANSDDLVNLGGSSRRWKQLFAGTATISTSDERCKDSIADIPDEVLNAWGKVRWRQFRFTDAVKEKGDAARLHSGAVAQDIQRVFSAEGLDASRYGLFCHDRWDAEPEQRDEEGSVVREAVSAGDRYSLRYEEALCMEAAFQRRRADRLEKRLADLEARLTAMEVANA